jgi:hypothetical protein
VKRKRRDIESAMYEPVRRYFEKECDCTKTHVDVPDDPLSFQLERNLDIREPDFIGIGKGSRVFMAEGKVLSYSSNAFDQCLAQAVSMKKYADYIFAFFPHDEWSTLPESDLETNKRALREQGIGLLLVDRERNSCEREMGAAHNTTFDKVSHDSIVKAFSGDADQALVETVSLPYAQAESVSRMLSLLQDLADSTVRDAFRKVFKRSYKKVFFKRWRDPSEPFYIWVHYHGSIGVEIDPFGLYLRDGRPCIWVFVETTFGKAKKWIAQPARKFGSHVHVEFEEGGYLCVPIPEIGSNPVISGLVDNHDFYICHHMDLHGRSKKGLSLEIGDLLMQAKKVR